MRLEDFVREGQELLSMFGPDAEVRITEDSGYGYNEDFEAEWAPPTFAGTGPHVIHIVAGECLGETGRA